MKCQLCDEELVADETYRFRDGSIVFRAHCPKCGSMYESNRPLAKRRIGVPVFPVDIGSFWLGFILGLTLWAIGLLIGKCREEKDTLNGAVAGFAVTSIVLCIVGIIYCSNT